MLDEKLLQERINQFQPEPLVETDKSKTKDDIETYMVTENENNIDLAKVNFLNMLNCEEIKKSSENIIRKYGVGTCGPRAFYGNNYFQFAIFFLINFFVGTTDVHLELERLIAEFFGMEESIVYSYGFVAISSSIAAYCKRKDVVFVDKKANFPIHQGLIASRCKVVYFDHNDPNSFREEAEKIARVEKNKPSRKFLIVEGVSWETGKLLPLPEFIKIAEDFKMRIFLDETYSIGIFGDTGRGLTEHFNVDPSRLDMIIATLESAIGSIGGFCAGSKLTIDHQRLAGSGYIFSASQPTFLVQACIEALKYIEDKPKKLRNFAKKFHSFLEETCKFEVDSDPESAFKVFRSTDKEKDVKIHEFCKNNGVHFIINQYGLLINLNVSLEDDSRKLESIYSVLKKASEL